MHYLGLSGMPRRISDYPADFEFYNTMSTAGSFVSLLSVLVFIWVFFDSMFFDNFDPRKILRYKKKFGNLAEIHAEIFELNYTKANLKARAKSAILNDVNAFKKFFFTVV
jgi:heme/copper-type cytochrome/quinol oxidase subunit 1